MNNYNGKQPVTVSNLTLDLWLNYVRPVLREANMLEEVPMKDDWHEFTGEVTDSALADELEHCMTVACFNAHQSGREEAVQLLYQLSVSIQYRPATAAAMTALLPKLTFQALQDA